MGVIDLLLAVVSGGATGILGTALGMFSKWMQARTERQAKEAEYAHVERMHHLNMESRKLDHANEVALAELRNAGEARLASYQHDSGYGQTYKWVAAVLRLVRPVLTIGLLYLCWRMFNALLVGAGEIAPGIEIADALTSADRSELVRYVVFNLTYAAVTALIWWFGGRDTTPPGRK